MFYQDFVLQISRNCAGDPLQPKNLKFSQYKHRKGTKIPPMSVSQIYMSLIGIVKKGDFKPVIFCKQSGSYGFFWGQLATQIPPVFWRSHCDDRWIGSCGEVSLCERSARDDPWILTFSKDDKLKGTPGIGSSIFGYQKLGNLWVKVLFLLQIPDFVGWKLSGEWWQKRQIGSSTIQFVVCFQGHFRWTYTLSN